MECMYEQSTLKLGNQSVGSYCVSTLDCSRVISGFSYVSWIIDLLLLLTLQMTRLESPAVSINKCSLLYSLKARKLQTTYFCQIKCLVSLCDTPIRLAALLCPLCSIICRIRRMQLLCTAPHGLLELHLPYRAVRKTHFVREQCFNMISSSSGIIHTVASNGFINVQFWNITLTLGIADRNKI